MAGVNASTSTTAVTSLATNTWKPVTGNTIAVFVEVASTSASVSSVRDTLGNIYARASSRSGSTGKIELWYSVGIVGGSSDAVTVTFSGSTKAVVRGEEFAGIPVKAVLQANNSNASTAPGTITNTSTITTSVSPSYLIADVGWDTAAAASATQGGFARIGQLSDGDSTATVTYLFAIANNNGTFGTGVTLSVSSNWQGVVAAFR